VRCDKAGHDVRLEVRLLRKHRRGVPGIREYFHAAVRVRREPDDRSDRRRGIGIFLAGGAENRQGRRALDVSLALRVSPSGQQHEGPDFRMTPAGLHRLVHAAAPAHHADRPVDDRWLRAEDLQRCVGVARHHFLNLLPLRAKVGERPGPAPAEAAPVDREDVVAGDVQHRGQLLVDPAIGVALMEEQDARPALLG